MRRTEIMIFLVFVNMALFGKIECDHCEKIDMFYFADWEILMPVYWRQTVFHLILCAWAFDNFWQSKKLISLFAFFLFIGWYADFFFRANLTWFRIYYYPFSYPAFASICFALVISISKLYERT